MKPKLNTTIAFNTMFKSCLESNDLQRAEKYFKVMISSGSKPSSRSLYVLMKLSNANHCFDKVEHYFNLFKEYRYIATSLEYNLLIDSLNQKLLDGSLTSNQINDFKHKIKNYYNEMIDSSTKLDVRCLNSFLLSLIRTNSSKEEIEAFFLNYSKFNIKSDNYTFSILVYYYLLHSYFEEAHYFWQLWSSSMEPSSTIPPIPQSSSPSPDHSPLNLEISKENAKLILNICTSTLRATPSFHSEEKVTQYYDYVTKILQIDADVHFLTTIIYIYAKLNNEKRVAEYFHKMVNYHHIAPTVATFTSMMILQIHSGDIEKAEELFNEMNNNYCIPPDAQFFSQLFRVCAVTANTQKAEKFWNEMIVHGVKPSVRTFLDYISVYKSAADLQTAHQLFLTMNDCLSISITDPPPLYYSLTKLMHDFAREENNCELVDYYGPILDSLDQDIDSFSRDDDPLLG